MVFSMSVSSHPHALHSMSFEITYVYAASQQSYPQGSWTATADVPSLRRGSYGLSEPRDRSVLHRGVRDRRLLGQAARRLALGWRGVT